MSARSDAVHPIVLVRNGRGQLIRAELHERHPTRAGVVKVIYVKSRTGAWVASRRISKTDPAPTEETS